jgi:hypothetical protein
MVVISACSQMAVYISFIDTPKNQTNPDPELAALQQTYLI